MNTQQTQNNSSKEYSEKLVERLKSLPKVIQDAILYSRWEDTIKTLSMQYKLRLDQTTMLENMVLTMMLGTTDVDEFLEFLTKDLALDEKTAVSLFSDIDYKIFTNIYEKVRAIDAAANPEEKKIDENNLTMIDLSDEMIAKASNEFKVNKLVKDDRALDSYQNEVLTVTRDEILKGVENPEQIKVPEDNLPELTSMNVMTNQVPNRPVQSAPQVPTPTPNPSSIPTSNPVANTIPVKAEQTNTINPVEAGLQNKVSTSIKGFSASDPYREPIQ